MSNENGCRADGKLERAEARLRDRLGGRVRELRLVAEEGGVVLRGYAFSYHDKQLAQHAAMHDLGLQIRANRIEVRSSPLGPGPGGPEPA